MIRNSCIQVRQRYRLPNKFILALGTVEPRKNLLNLLEAFRLILQEELDLTLVLVGRKGWKEEPVFEKIASLGLDNKIYLDGIFTPKRFTRDLLFSHGLRLSFRL